MTTNNVNHKIYSKLVKTKNDYVGMIAYSIYKRDKLAKVKKGEDVSTFVVLKESSVELKRYREEAQEVFNNALKVIVEEKITEREEEIKNNILLLGGVKRSRFWIWHNSGAAGVIGNIYTFLISALIVYIFSSNAGWKAATDSALSFFKSILNVN
ncbi:hypothetical protein [Pantoea sp. C2G6]|uniref:hypothetical protein n=1 Tax=Pantoea sp. C2G6 TaxID=3243084 RepID=UPI003EDB48F2